MPLLLWVQWEPLHVRLLVGLKFQKIFDISKILLELKTNNIVFVILYDESGFDIYIKVSEGMPDDLVSLDYVNTYVTTLLSSEPPHGNSNYLHLTCIV